MQNSWVIHCVFYITFIVCYLFLSIFVGVYTAYRRILFINWSTTLFIIVSVSIMVIGNHLSSAYRNRSKKVLFHAFPRNCDTSSLWNSFRCSFSCKATFLLIFKKAIVLYDLSWCIVKVLKKNKFHTHIKFPCTFLCRFTKCSYF